MIVFSLLLGTNQAVGVTQDSHSLSVWDLPAVQLYPVQTLLAARDLDLPQRAVHHSVFHFTGLVHSRKYLKRNNFQSYAYVKEFGHF